MTELAAASLVLIVDDFAGREMHAESLRFAGFAVDEAPNGRDALDKVAAFAPDAIVMDLSLPELDGVRRVLAGGAAGCPAPNARNHGRR